MTDTASSLESRIAAIEPADNERRAELRNLYDQHIPMLLRAERYKDALEACNRYLELFPGHGYDHPIRRWMAEAKQGMNPK